MPVYTPDGVLVELVYDGPTGVRENTLWFLWQAGTSMSGTDLDDLCAAVFTWWDTYIKPLVHTTIVLREILARDMSSGSGVSGSYPASVAGTATGSLMTSQDTLCISFRTLLAGRSYRGRNYIVSLTETNVVEDTVSSGVAIAWVDAYADMPAVIDIGTGVGLWQWSINSTRTNNADRLFGVLTPVNNVVVVDDTIDSMNRRLEGRGE